MADARIGVISRHVSSVSAQCSVTPATVASSDNFVDVVIVGAGFSGLYALHKLRSLGLRVHAFDKSPSVGGCWWANRYPGCKCDIESLQYCYSFSPELQQEWTWPDKYSSRDEILKYLNHVADRFDLRKDISLSKTVVASHWNEAASQWSVFIGDGSQIACRFLVFGSGPLDKCNWPKIPGFESFQGRTLHTQGWPENPIDFSGRRVGVIGTGSTGVQLIPKVAETAKQLFVFQRTPSYVIPARQTKMKPDIEAKVKERYPTYNLKYRWQTNLYPYDRHPDAGPLPQSVAFADLSPEQQKERFDKFWAVGSVNFLSAFSDMQANLAANEGASEYVRSKIRDIILDPATADALTPSHLLVCKRLCVSDGFYETFNQPNVTLLDLRQNAGKIDEITANGVRIGEMTYELDDLICATGFDAMTGALNEIDIRGANGKCLRELWSEGPRTLLGLQCTGFPNMFTVCGPHSPTVLANCVSAIEQHVDWIVDCIAYVTSRGKTSIEASADAQDAWYQHHLQTGAAALVSGGHGKCGTSWYTGTNMEGKPGGLLPYVGSFVEYKLRCDAIAANGYDGFILR